MRRDGLLGANGSGLSRVLASLLLGAQLLGCGDKDGGDSGSAGDSGDPDSGDPDSGDPDSGDPDSADTGEPPPPCADETWGAIDDPDASVHVRADGHDPSADGSPRAPFATLTAAIALVRAGGTGGTVAVGPGTYTENIKLVQADSDGNGDHGLTVVGCSRDEVTLAADDEDASVLQADAVVDFAFRSLTISGGTRGVLIKKESSAALSDLLITGCKSSGLVMDGSNTSVTVDEVDITAIFTDDDGERGYGMAVQGADVTVSGGSVSDTVRVGVLVSAGSFVWEDGSVSATSSDGDGRFGRGLQAQSLAEVSLRTVHFEDNHDAGIFALGAAYLGADGVTVERTSGVTLPDGSDTTGDGIVAGPGDFGVAYYVVDLTSNTVDGADRGGIVLDGVTASLSGNTVSADYEVGGVSVFAQNGAVVSGSDTVVTLDGSTADPLEMDLEALDVESF